MGNAYDAWHEEDTQFNELTQFSILAIFVAVLVLDSIAKVSSPRHIGSAAFHKMQPIRTADATMRSNCSDKAVPMVNPDKDAHFAKTMTEEFQADPFLPMLFANQQDDVYCLGLVTNWPPPQAMKEPYQQLVQVIQNECFYPEDVTSTAQQEHPAVAFMPFDSLHITVATLFTTTPVDEMTIPIPQLEEDWKQIALQASKLPEWPQTAFHLQIDSAKIASRAGILLWKETTGGLDQMRKCLQQIVHQDEGSTRQYAYLHDVFSFPSIVHTTILRYSSVPQATSHVHAQSQMDKTVLPQLHEIFSKPIVANVAKVVNCKIYLNSPENEHSVVCSLPLV
jgi:hypothetical protein